MSEYGCGDAQVVAGAAVELFQLASLLVGDEADAASVVEQAVSAADIDPCQEREALRRAARLHVLQSALNHLNQQHPGSLAAPEAHTSAGSCIDSDDIAASGVSQTQLAEWVAGAGRNDLRHWLEQLPTAQRAVFVQRAVLGQDSDAAALTLRRASSGAWTSEVVGETFRMALCSLANRFAHSPAVAPGTPATI